MQIEELFRIWDRFEGSKATEVVFEANSERFCLKKEGKETVPAAQVNTTAVPAVMASEGQTVHADKKPMVTGTAVKAPFVGTFYRSSAPGEEPFVRLGQKVNKGDVIGIIEAMKLMNEITAPCDGTVTDIFVEDETLVEFDQLLVSIGE